MTREHPTAINSEAYDHDHQQAIEAHTHEVDKVIHGLAIRALEIESHIHSVNKDLPDDHEADSTKQVWVVEAAGDRYARVAQNHPVGSYEQKRDYRVAKTLFDSTKYVDENPSEFLERGKAEAEQKAKKIYDAALTSQIGKKQK
ncbi:MAG: hypothetical protein ABIQ64_03725 [Candidatus Saccharimonadales bacterium]